MDDEPLPILAVDLSEAPYDEWLAFVFDHEALPEGASLGDSWYWASELELKIDPVRQVAYLKRLFEQPDYVVSVYTEEQIEQGFWFMFSGSGTDWFLDVFWAPEVSWPDREACILAIPILYERLFVHDEDGDGVAWMLWDFLAFGYDCGNRKPAKREEDRRVQEAMLAALSEMLLSSGSAMAQRAALHGLFHLNHADGHSRIHEYLDSRWTSQSLRDYAENVLIGHAL